MPVGIEGLVENNDLGRILAIVQRDECHLAAPRRLGAQLRDHAGDSHRRLRRLQRAEWILHELRELLRMRVIRMTREVEAEARLFMREPLAV